MSGSSCWPRCMPAAVTSNGPLTALSELRRAQRVGIDRAEELRRRAAEVAFASRHLRGPAVAASDPT